MVHGFEADRVAPRRRHDSGRQSIVAVDIRLEWMMDPRKMNLSTKLTALLWMCGNSGDGSTPKLTALLWMCGNSGDGSTPKLTALLWMCGNSGDGSTPNFMILGLAQLVLRPSLEAPVSKMANADEMSNHHLLQNLLYCRHHGCDIFHDAVEQIGARRSLV